MTETTPIRVRRRTGQQITAATPNASVWVSANAGTGKTGVLVDRISRLLLAGVEPERILCLTFTKAAAAEMANRLSALLSNWSAMPEAVLIEELRALGEPDVDGDLVTRARRLFALTLEAPEGLRIRTIHSFCESLLGRFPLEARIAPDFRVMDERDQREMQLEARDSVLSQAAAMGTHLTDALRALAALVDEDGFAGLMKELDGARAKFRTALVSTGGPDGLVRAVYDALGIATDATVETTIRGACDIDDITRAKLERLCAAWDDGAKTNNDAARDTRAWLAMAVEQRAVVWRDMYASIFLKKDGDLKAEKTLMSKGAFAKDPDALGIAFELGEDCRAVLDTLRAINTAEATRALIRVGATLIDAYEEIKQHRGRLDYDDLIERASTLLSTPAGISWVHYKLDGGIEHVLVDEAQDTSPEQWRVIEEIASDFFSGESRYEEKAERPRTVFAVGDEKQSIYSFQGADPVMFGRMKELFAARIASVERVWKPVEMAESFRSAPAVLKVVDKVFEDPGAAHGLSFGDSRVHHISARVGQAGHVELWPREETEVDDGEDEPWDMPLDHIATDSPESRVARRIAGTIKGWIDKGEILPAQGRPVRPGDILILVQKRRRFAELMVSELKKLDVDVSGRDRMILPDQLVIQDLIALGRLTLLPDDDLNTATVLKGPLIRLSEDQLYDIAYARDGQVLGALRAKRDAHPSYREAWDTIALWRRRADFTPPFEFFSSVLNAEGGRRALLARLGPEAADPIDDFMSAALDYERDHVPSMEGFLHWIETGAAEVKRDLEQGRNEVRVMTVHGAKGLQAEIVFLADACTVPAAQNQDRIRWFENEGAADIPVWPGFADNETDAVKALKEVRRTETLQEYRRLLYVALTRAKDRLYIAGFTGKRPPKETSWHDMVAQALEAIGTPAADPDGRARLIYTEPQTNEPDGGGEAPDRVKASTALPAWATAPPGAEPSPPKPLSPSRPDDAEPPVRSPLHGDDGTRFKRGLVVHALMQTLPELPIDSRRESARRYLARPMHGFSDTAQAALLGEVMAVLEAPEIAALFGPGARAEVPVAGTVATADGLRVVSGQIDRLVHTGKEVLIVDFKTNRPAPDRADAVAPIYLRQMATYRAALESIFPDVPIRAVLLWTDGPKWMELPDKLLDAHAP